MASGRSPLLVLRARTKRRMLHRSDSSSLFADRGVVIRHAINMSAPADALLARFCSVLLTLKNYCDAGPIDF